MPALPNTRHERFAQIRAYGIDGKPVSIDEAYKLAGFKANSGNATRLNGNESIQARIQELTEAAAAKAGVTKQRVMEELAKIGFADIRKAVIWRANVVGMTEDEETGEERIIAHNEVVLMDSDKIDDATAGAISEISQNAQGGIKVKFHDKRAALVDMGKELGMFKDVAENHNFNHDVSAEPMTAEEWEAEHAPGERTH